MITVKDILNLDLSKIKSAPLKSTIEDWISDYQKEDNKELFEEESKQTIEKLYDMVSRFAPEAIQKERDTKSEKATPKQAKPKAPKAPATTPKEDQFMKVLFLVMGDFNDVLEELKASDLEEADLVVWLEMTEKLENAIKSGDKDAIKQAVEKQMESFVNWQKKIMQNANKAQQNSAKKATKAMNKLLKELGIDPIANQSTSKSADTKTKKPATYTMSDGMKWELLSLEEAQKLFKENAAVYGINRDEETEALIEEKDDFKRFEEFGVPYEVPSQATILTKDLVKSVVAELIDIEIDLKGEDETIIATTRLDLEEALEEEKHTQFRKKVASTVKDFKDWVDQLTKAQQKETAISAMNKLLNALGHSELNQDGDEVEESEEERSKRILEELAALEPELAQCRAVVSEANRKKREAEGPKPKKRRLTKLKDKLLSIASLIPPQLKDNIDVLEKTEKILLKTHSQLVDTWGMSKVQAKHGAKALEEKFEGIEEKLSKQVESYSFNSLKAGGFSITTKFKDGHKETTKLLKETLDWINDEHGGSLDKVNLKKVLDKNATLEKKSANQLKKKKPSTYPKYLQGIVDQLETKGLTVQGVDKDRQVTDASIVLADNYQVQIVDYSSKEPTFILCKEVEKGKFLHYEETTSIEDLVKQFNKAKKD